jgi:hypothetical protein
MNRNLVGSILGSSSIRIAHLVPIRKQTWPPETILVSDWLISKKSSPLKPLCQMNQNLVGSILGRSSIIIIIIIIFIQVKGIKSNSNALRQTHYTDDI